jgi:hypothetical protein
MKLVPPSLPRSSYCLVCILVLVLVVCLCPSFVHVLATLIFISNVSNTRKREWINDMTTKVYCYV